MKISHRELIREVSDAARKLEEKVTVLEDADPAILMKPPAPGSWNALECLEHLSLAYDHYLPRIEAALRRSRQKGWKPEADFKPGFWGQQMVRGTRPDSDGSIGFKMKTFKKTTPAIEGQPADVVISRFLSQHRRFIQYVENSRDISLEKARVASLIGPVLRFRLGDALRFIQAHNERHWLQLVRGMKKVIPAGKEPFIQSIILE